MSYPKSADEWWASVEANKQLWREWLDPIQATEVQQRIETLARPMSQPVRVIYAQAAPTDDIHDIIDRLTKARDTRLWHILQSIWEDAPDSPHIHGWAGWGALCDLCSEGPAVLPGLDA